ncbi:MAG: hypothetical protein ACREP6_02465, partial [Candidatus Binataceae bacterium]
MENRKTSRPRSRTARITSMQARAGHANHAREKRTVVKVGSDFYVLASSLISRRKTSVLADAQSFAVFEAGGDILESPL